MAVENLKEVQDWFETNKENEEIKNYIGGFVTPDRVNGFLESDEGKKLLQPKLDSYFSKGLESWKGNNLSKLIDEEVKKRFPEADPKDTKLAELQAQIQKMQKETTRKELTNKALKTATEKKLPVELIDYFIGEDEETTTKNIESLEKVFSTTVDKLVEERLKGSYTPPKDKTPQVFTLEDIKKMTPEEVNKNWEAVKKVMNLK